MDSPIHPKRWLLHGVVITFPIVVTLLIVVVVLDFILGILSPVVDAVAYLWPDEPSMAVIQLSTILTLFGFFLVVGFVADLTPGRHVSRLVDRTMATIPGLSTIYTSMRRAGNVLIEENTDQFQEVLLVEFPHGDAYMFGFLIGETPQEITKTLSDEDLVTVMVPLGPNPTTNGFIMHMPTEHVHEVDLTVEEAVRSIATLGVDEVSDGMN